MNDTNLLHMKHIVKEFTGVRALDDVNLQIAKGEVHAICGENGAGKSTLMKVLSGVWPSGTYEGEIIFEGKKCEFKNIKDSEKVGIVIIHQELALSPFLSVAENIFLGSEIAKGGMIDWHETHRRTRELLDEVGLDVDPRTIVSDLGVGKQQLVEIAKALSKDVKLLILDEPTAALNDDDSAHLLDLMRRLQARGVSQVIISHKLNEISDISDRVTIIRDGHTIGTWNMKGEDAISQQDIIRHMVGRELSNLFPEHVPNKGGEVLLEVKDWTVHHPIDKERQVVKQANLTVRKGEIVGIAGLMGAGRTELAMSMFGHSYGVNISGSVYMHGKKKDTSTVRKAVKAGLAYVPEDRKGVGLNLIQDVQTNTTAAGLARLVRAGVVNEHEEVKVVNTYRKDLRIKTRDNKTIVGTLSGGNQQKVVLAKWMYTEPELLILDEPTRGIDVGAKYEIYQIINSLADSGKGVLVISSELPEILGICDRIYTLNEGRMTGCFDRADATQESLMEYMAGDAKKEVA